MQVRYKTNVPIAQKGKTGKRSIRKVPFFYDQQEWQQGAPLPPLGYEIGFKDTRVLFQLEEAVTSQNGSSALLMIAPVEDLYPEETVDELINAGFCVLDKEYVHEG